MFNCVLTPSHTAQNLQAPVENLGPVSSLNKLWNALGRVVNLSPLQTKCPNSHLPSAGSHRALGVLQSPPPGMRGQLGHYICTKSKQPAQFSSVHRGKKKGGGTKYRPLDNLFVLRVFKTHSKPQQVINGQLCAITTQVWRVFYVESVSKLTPHGGSYHVGGLDKSLTLCIHDKPGD